MYSKFLSYGNVSHHFANSMCGVCEKPDTNSMCGVCVLVWRLRIAPNLTQAAWVALAYCMIAAQSRQEAYRQ